MVITPTLPAMAGYIEIVDDVGNHVYKPTQDTIDKQKLQELIDQLQATQTEQGQVVDTIIGVKNEMEVVVE